MAGVIYVESKLEKHHKELLNRHKKQLKQKLTELFQIDSPDLDFGVYRILNQKRDEILRFMNEDLINAVDAEFGKYDDETRTQIVDEIKALERTIKETYGGDSLNAKGLKEEFRKTAKGKELHEKWIHLRQDIESASMSDLQKAQIFEHLEEFFSRYYKDGDFLSLRRYAANEKYAIPYNGEEVLLHWANRDQYYIKTDRFLKSHGFDVGSYRILFEVVEAEGELDGNGKGRFFVLISDDPITFSEDKRLLTIRFAHVPLSNEEVNNRFTPGAGRQKPNQDDLVDGLVNEILKNEEVPKGLSEAFQGKEREEDKNPRLRKNFMSFSRQNTSDFFIHKDLGGFLRQELDFYIKNEVFRLDDLGTDNGIAIGLYVKRVNVLKVIAHRIIDYIAHLENFQKTLWEKKKFVLRSGYCITLDCIPEEYYGDILTNDNQLAEWEKLYKIGINQTGQRTFDSERIDKTFLKNHPFLVIDTAFFSEEFTDNLLERIIHPDNTSVDDLDEAIGGLIVKSENWQALNLLQERFREQIKCIYIDPPYNTGSDEFIYRDNYQHSSWLSMMSDRLAIGRNFINQEGMAFINADDHEQSTLNIILKSIFGQNNFLCSAIWEKVYSPRMDAKSFSSDHDYILVFSKSEKVKINKIPFEQNNTQFSFFDQLVNKYYRRRSLRKEGSGSLRSDRPNLYYPIKAPDSSIVYPIRQDGREGRWRWEESTYLERKNDIDWVKSPEGWQPYVKQYLEEAAYQPPSTIWRHSDAGHNHEAAEEIKALFKDNVFLTPKPTRLIQYILTISNCQNNEFVLDFFAGSGTTAHGVINQNIKDKINRKYILVESADFFDNITKSRIQKVMYSSNWKEGKPLDTKGQSHIFKYLELEQYEDTLNNIEFLDRDGHLQASVFGMKDYMLHYFLNVETRESQCRLNIDRLTSPFDYTLKIRREIGFEQFPADEEGFREVPVDLVETFNYLLGLHVKRKIVRKRNGNVYRVIHGMLPNNTSATIIWRKCPLDPSGHEQELEEDAHFINDVILKEFPETGIIYVNGHCFAPRATPIEPTFKKLMGA